MFNAPLTAHAAWAIDVRSLATGELLYQMNVGKLMMPASNMKILTLAAAAEVLGWDARFSTTLETAAAVEGGVLRGDLIVRGGGDPTINSRNGRAAALFDEWAGTLKSAGIRQIDGRIVGDDQAFDDEGLGDGWSWDYLQYGYAAPVGALQYNEDVAELTVGPGETAGDPAIVRLAAGSGLTVLNRCVTSAAGVTETVGYRRRLDQAVLEVTGMIPPGAQTISRNVAVLNPTVFFAHSLKDALAARGIEIRGDAVDIDEVAAGLAPPSAERRVLATAWSAPLREVAGVLMKVSQNLYAETLLKATGAVAGGLGTTAAGRQTVQRTLAGWGISEGSYVMADGSGLSRYNYVTAATITRILEQMYKDARHREAFMAALPVAGKDGTVATRMRRTRADGNAMAKTGSIANVRSLSGYVRTRDGEPLVFAMIANDFTVPAATVNWMADLGVEILANFTRR